jgi:transcriptional regulator with XRE-family HTH domain
MTGRDLLRLRRRAGCTQHELATFAGLLQPNVYQAETGRRKITPQLELRLRAALSAIEAELRAVPKVTVVEALKFMEELLEMRDDSRAAARRAAVLNIILRRFVEGRD